MSEVNVTSLDATWAVQDDPVGSASSRGRIRAASGAARDLPAYLSTSDSLVPIRQVVATSEAAARRDAFAPVRPLRIEVQGVGDQSVIAAARHESGAITFHLPESTTLAAGGATRRGGAGGARGDTVVFSIPVLPGDDLAPNLRAGPQRRGVVSKVIKTVVFKAARIVARPVLQLLAQKLEQRLWRGAGRREGWVRVTRDTLAAGQPLPHAVPSASRNQRTLLLVHGTFSHTAAAYQDLARGDFFDAVAPIYGDRIFGFDHFTISKSPEANVADLLADLSRVPTFDVVTHSRGGLVLQTLAHHPDRVKLGRVVLVASPNQGTPLATPQRWEDTLGWFANLLEMIPENPFTTAAAWISESLSWLAQNLTELPGLHSMDGDGEVIAGLGRNGLPPDADCYALVSNYSAPPHQALRLADMGIDAFFTGANDLVVPTEGGWKLGPQGNRLLPADRIGCFGPGGNLSGDGATSTNHIEFFRVPAAQTFLRKALTGEALGLTPIANLNALQRRRASDQVMELAATASAAVEAVTKPAAAPPVAPTVASTPPPISDGWNSEDALHLIVLGPTDRKSTKTQEAQLLAIYGSARTWVTFRLGGEGAGSRWSDVIEFQKQITDYAEGKTDEAPSAELIQKGGAVMFDILFDGEVRRLYDQARYRHQHRRLNVIFTSMIPWVADLPWEFAYDASCQAFLATSDVRFIRNVLTPVPADNIPVKTGPIRILLVSALPPSATPLSLEEERALVLRAFQPLIEVGAVEVDLLPEATPDALHAWVRQRTYDVIHFMGHGEFDDETETGSLIFVDSQRQAQKVPASSIKDILRGRGIRLVFLNACETGRGSRADYNKGVAPGLVADGVPAVVANQYSVLDRFATTFSQQFYWCLAQGLSLGDAARESRIALNYSGGGSIDWAVPVLFARNPNARLCEGTIRLDAPQVLPRTSVAERRATAHHRYRIDVWDVTDSFLELDDALEEMTKAQKVFGFRRASFTAPYGTWSVDPTRFDGVAYLSAERTARRLRQILDTLEADFLLCVTDLPLRSRDIEALYAWWEDRDLPLILFSTWDLKPPLRGERLSRALANVTVEALGGVFSDNQVRRGPKGSVFYFNDERDVDHITGRLTIDAANAKKLQKAVSPDIMDAFQILLGLFHPLPPAQPAEMPGKPARVSRPKRPRAHRTTRTPPTRRRRSRTSR